MSFLDLVFDLEEWFLSAESKMPRFKNLSLLTLVTSDASIGYNLILLLIDVASKAVLV